MHYGKCGSGAGIAFSQSFVTLMPSGLLVLTPRDSAHHQQLIYLLMLTFPISSLKNASKKIHIFFLLPAQGSLQFLSLDLDYNNNNFICTKRLSVVQKQQRALFA